MLLQRVSVMVAPFGITRIASALANSSDGPWAEARLLPARAVELHRIVAINRAAYRIKPLRSDVLGLHRIAAWNSWDGISNRLGTDAGVGVLAPHQLRLLASGRGAAAVATTLRAGREDVAIPMPH